MIKQLVSKDIKKYLETGSDKVLLDVRTKEELVTVGFDAPPFLDFVN